MYVIQYFFLFIFSEFSCWSSSFVVFPIMPPVHCIFILSLFIANINVIFDIHLLMDGCLNGYIFINKNWICQHLLNLRKFQRISLRLYKTIPFKRKEMGKTANVPVVVAIAVMSFIKQNKTRYSNTDDDVDRQSLSFVSIDDWLSGSLNFISILVQNSSLTDFFCKSFHCLSLHTL